MEDNNDKKFKSIEDKNISLDKSNKDIKIDKKDNYKKLPSWSIEPPLEIKRNKE